MVHTCNQAPWEAGTGRAQGGCLRPHAKKIQSKHWGTGMLNTRGCLFKARDVFQPGDWGAKVVNSPVTFVLRPHQTLPPIPYLEPVCLCQSITLPSPDPYLQPAFSVTTEPVFMEDVTCTAQRVSM